MDPVVDDAWTQFLPGQRLDDQSCIARFFLKPKLLGKKSKDLGRPIYEDREYVEIMVKGQPQQIVHKEVGKEDIERFPNAYAAFKRGAEAPVVGTPVEKMEGIGPSFALKLKSIGIRTVEDLSNCSDQALQDIGMGARSLQEKAKQMLSAVNPSIGKLEEENQELRKRLAALEAAVQPKRRGRPPKQVTL